MGVGRGDGGKGGLRANESEPMEGFKNGRGSGG